MLEKPRPWFKEPVLTAQQEEQLKRKMLPLWMEKDVDGWKYTGWDIAEILGFGKGEYAKVKPEYVYYYRMKFSLPKREKERFTGRRYKHGKQHRPIDYQVFCSRLERFRPEEAETKHRKSVRRMRAFNILAFYSGFRQGEIRRLRREDFEVNAEEGYLRVNAFRLKKRAFTREEVESATMPIFLPLEWPYVEELIRWIQQFEDHSKVFDVSPVTAWKYVKMLFPKGYPHYYRLNRITNLVDNPDISIQEIQRWSGLSLQMIQSYLSKSDRYAKRVARKMKIEK